MTVSGQLALDGFVSSDAGVAVRRSSSLYGVHAYHTKIPAEAITGFIEAHSEPGDVVLDPFCGSGMTGVAAGLIDRRAVLNDLSPAAVHIASNYTAPCDPAAFNDAVRRVLHQVGDRIADLYRTTHDGRAAQIEYLVWSELRRCTACGEDLLLWNAREAGLRSLTCPRCRHEAAKADLPIVGERAVEANLSRPGGQRIVRPAVEADLRPDLDLPGLPWYPDMPFDASRPMWRRGHDDLGITSVADFYSERNLTALSLLWDAASNEPEERLRSALRFSLTAIANRASRRYQWNAKRPTNVLGGTLYISSLRYEWNVLSLWQRKTRAVTKLFAARVAAPGAVDVVQGSATALPLADESIDYCFTDPPFGSHIVYSDASLLWEAWLNDLTDREREAIVVRTGDQAKTVDDYGALLRGAFGEIRRVLRPRARATVVFQASDPDTWSAVYDAAAQVGLGFLEATTLSKGQPSFKQIKGQREGEMVAETDVVLTFSREASPRHLALGITAEDAVRAASRAALAAGRPTSAGALFADVNARLLRGAARPIGIRDVRKLLDQI
ncbi:MAG TPA: DNA methyltransferase [Miltoncostaeaceae bacterium]|nr:DNA methyltransferase [Miltoncostaeaceae bacterium]